MVPEAFRALALLYMIIGTSAPLLNCSLIPSHPVGTTIVPIEKICECDSPHVTAQTRHAQIETKFEVFSYLSFSSPYFPHTRAHRHLANVFHRWWRVTFMDYQMSVNHIGVALPPSFIKIPQGITSRPDATIIEGLRWTAFHRWSKRGIAPNNQERAQMTLHLLEFTRTSKNYWK